MIGHRFTHNNTFLSTFPEKPLWQSKMLSLPVEFGQKKHDDNTVSGQSHLNFVKQNAGNFAPNVYTSAAKSAHRSTAGTKTQALITTQTTDFTVTASTYHHMEGRMT